MSHGVTEDPLPKGSFDRIIKSVLQLSGYFGPATVHAIRRSLGKKIDGTFSVLSEDEQVRGLADNLLEIYTEVQRSQHITQTDTRVYGQSYVANTSSVDGRSAFLDEPTQHDHVEYFQSFASLRERGLPLFLPAEEEAAINEDENIIKLQSNVTQLKGQNAPPSEIRAAQQRVRNSRIRLARIKLKEYQLVWIQERRDWKVMTRGKERSDDNRRTDLLKILTLIMPELGRLTQTMVSDTVVSEQDRRQAIEDLFTLISRDYTVIYRPGEEPIDGACPVNGCGAKMVKYD